ncbi:MAG: hypothetical protein MRY32_08415 [Rickettsiales bacterium]|nr:hypothetical protein [Rickettsiales bacterium]
MGTFIKIVGILFLLALAGGGIWFGFQIKQGVKLDKTSRTFVETQLPKLAKNRWYGPHMRPIAHTKFMEAVSMEDWQKLSEKYYRALGPMQEFGECQGQAKIHYGDGGKLITADYACDAFFEKAAAKIEVQLTPEGADTNWKIIKINIVSNAFL